MGSRSQERQSRDDLSSERRRHHNAVSKQLAFRAAHPVAGTFKLDFPFNGSGAVVDPEAMPLAADLTEDLVAAVMANKANFRFINHTFTHADMDKAPVPADAPCDYADLYHHRGHPGGNYQEPDCLGASGSSREKRNNRVLISGNHSGLKDRKCTEDPALHPEMFDVQADDVAFDQGGANPLFLQAAANVGVDYLASDSSQRARTSSNISLSTTMAARRTG